MNQNQILILVVVIAVIAIAAVAFLLVRKRRSENLRKRLIKNFLVTLFVSRGTYASVYSFLASSVIRE